MQDNSIWLRLYGALAGFFLTHDHEDNFQIKEESNFQFVKALFSSLLCSLIIVTSSSIWIDSTLEDGSVKENSRWSHLKPAYEYISEQPSDDIIFIGSSRLFSGIDARCFEDNSIHNETSYWNLAIRGDLPYLRLPESDSLSSTGAKIVVIETGPNTFNSGTGTRDDYLRWEVESLSFDFDGDESWWDLIRPNDRSYLADTTLDRFNIRQQFSPEAADEIAHRALFFGGSRAMQDGDGSMPKAHSSLWPESLKNPYRNEETVMSEEEMKIYIDRIQNSSFWKPSSENHLNNISLNHIVKSLEKNGIIVIFYSPPVHPDFLQALSPGHWDEFNYSMESLQAESRFFIDHTFEIWDSNLFTDPIHFSNLGRDEICNNFGSILDSILMEL